MLSKIGNEPNPYLQSDYDEWYENSIYKQLAKFNKLTESEKEAYLLGVYKLEGIDDEVK